MKMIILILILCFIYGCANKDYFNVNGKKGPYIPRYLHINPEKKAK